jgi:hypothetical protein
MKYKITEGNHCTSTLQWPFTAKREVTKTVRFSESCLTPVDEDISKLFGLSDGWDIHEDSVRIGWRSEGKVISLWAYIYSGGERIMEHITHVAANETFVASVEIKNSYYAIHLTTSTGYYQSVNTRVSRWKGPRVLLRPYFGGNAPSLVDMEIDLI